MWNPASSSWAGFLDLGDYAKHLGTWRVGAGDARVVVSAAGPSAVVSCRSKRGRLSAGLELDCHTAAHAQALVTAGYKCREGLKGMCARVDVLDAEAGGAWG